MEIVKRSLEQRKGPDGIRRSRWGIIRNSYPVLKTTTLKTWLDWVKPTIFGKPVMDTPIRHFVKLNRETELEVYFVSIDRPDEIDKLLSFELSGIWLNEARELPKAVLDMATGRVGRFPAPKDVENCWYGVIMDTNPPDDDHWWYSLAEEERPEGYGFYHQPSGLSPEAENIPNLPKDYYRRMMAGKDPEWIKVYVKGEYGSVEDGKPVYPEFSYRLHVSDTRLGVYRKLPLIIGHDFGLCYDDKTEVLTDPGWKFFKDVNEKSDKVATRNPETGEMSFVLPNFKVDKPWDGDLIGFKSQNVDFLVTPEHRIPLYKRTGHNGDKPGKDTPMFFESAEWALNNASKHLFVAAKSKWSGKDVGMFGMSPDLAMKTLSNVFQQSSPEYARMSRRKEFLQAVINESKARVLQLSPDMALKQIDDIVATVSEEMKK
jgi:hypothetical protein